LHLLLTRWDAQIWLTLQAKWDLWHAMKARAHSPKVRPLRRQRARNLCGDPWRDEIVLADDHLVMGTRPASQPNGVV
jgi:hypothetical protein